MSSAKNIKWFKIKCPGVKNGQGILLLLLIVFYIVNGVFYIRSQSAAFDEDPYFNYAKRYVTGHPGKTGSVIDDSKLPVIALNTIPRVVQQILHPGLRKMDSGIEDIFMGRYVTLLASVLTILLVFKWATELYGKNAGLFAAFLIAFCPNCLANAGLVGEDSYSVFALLLVMYCTWKCFTVKSLKWFLLLCLTLAVSQLVKQTFLHLYLVTAFCFSIYYLLYKPAVNVKKLVTYLVYFIVINWFVINAGFYFYDTNTLLSSYHFYSKPFIAVQHFLPGWLPVPFPRPFVDGLDMVKYNNDIGGGYSNSTFANVTILGRSSTGGSFWYYYIVSVFYKTPVSMLVFMACSVIVLLKQRNLKAFLANEFLLILPVVYFFITLSVFVKIQSGIRHIIFIYPFLFIISSCIIPFIKNGFRRIGILVLSAYLVISVLFYWGNYYTYTNEFIADKKMAYDYVGTSNLDYGGGQYFYAEYLATHPAVQWAPLQPKAGTFLITTPDYMDVWNTKKYGWISRFKPSGHVAYSGLLITVKPEDVAR